MEMQRDDTTRRPYCSRRPKVIQSVMPDRNLMVVAGALPRRSSGKVAHLRDAIAKRWRLEGAWISLPLSAEPAKPRDVIPLLDGWIRRLEREAAGGQPT